jgi:hypothetical protein
VARQLLERGGGAVGIQVGAAREETDPRGQDAAHHQALVLDGSSSDGHVEALGHQVDVACRALDLELDVGVGGEEGQEHGGEDAAGVGGDGDA